MTLLFLAFCIFLMNFRINLPISKKRKEVKFWEFDWGCIKLIDKLGEYLMFIIPCPIVHVHVIHLDSFIFSQ